MNARELGSAISFSTAWEKEWFQLVPQFPHRLRGRCAGGSVMISFSKGRAATAYLNLEAL
jgi:hypothetical protein